MLSIFAPWSCLYVYVCIPTRNHAIWDFNFVHLSRWRNFRRSTASFAQEVDDGFATLVLFSPIKDCLILAFFHKTNKQNGDVTQCGPFWRPYTGTSWKRETKRTNAIEPCTWVYALNQLLVNVVLTFPRLNGRLCAPDWKCSTWKRRTMSRFESGRRAANPFERRHVKFLSCLQVSTASHNVISTAKSCNQIYKQNHCSWFQQHGGCPKHCWFGGFNAKPWWIPRWPKITGRNLWGVPCELRNRDFEATQTWKNPKWFTVFHTHAHLVMLCEILRLAW